MSAPPPRRRLAFGPFVLDVDGHRLTRGGVPVVLGDRAWGVLVELATHPGEVLSKDELVQRVWPDVGVSDEALSQAVHELRKVLGDKPRSPLYVQTVHGRGYRFVAPVAPVEEAREIGPAEAASLPRRLRFGVLAGVFVVTLVVAGLWRLVPRAPRRPVPQRIEELVRLPGGAFKPAFAPDGRAIAVVSSEEGGRHGLFLVRPGVPGALSLTRGLDVRGPAPTFSADGNWVLFTCYRSDAAGRTMPEVWRVPVLGGRAELVLEKAAAAHQDRSGERLVFSRVGTDGTSVVVRDADGSEQTVAEVGFWPRWSPDGEWIAYTTSDPEGGSGDLFVVRPNGAERRKLTRGPWQFYGLDWTPRAEGVVFAAAREGPFQLWYVAQDGGSPVRLTVGAGEDSCPAVAPDGSRLLFVNGRMRSSVLVAEGLAAPFRRVSDGDAVLSVAFGGPAGWVAVGRLRAGVGGSVGVIKPDSPEVQGLAGFSAVRVRWAAGGQALVVAGSRDGGGGRGIHRVEWPSGATTTLVSDCACDWPDLGENTLVYVRLDEKKAALVVRELGGGRERVLVERPELVAPRVSPDGRWVAWSGLLRPTDESSSGIWVMPVDGSSAPRRLAPDGAWPAWESSDSVLFVRGASGDSLWRANLPGGSPTLVRSLDVGFPVSAFDADADRQLAVAVHVDTPAVFAFEGLRLPP